MPFDDAVEIGGKRLGAAERFGRPPRLADARQKIHRIPARHGREQDLADAGAMRPFAAAERRVETDRTRRVDAPDHHREAAIHHGHPRGHAELEGEFPAQHRQGDVAEPGVGDGNVTEPQRSDRPSL